jgi:hypothetical protein
MFIALLIIAVAVSVLIGAAFFEAAAWIAGRRAADPPQRRDPPA